MGFIHPIPICFLYFSEGKAKMKETTDMEGVKSTAKMLLYLDIGRTEFSPIVVTHPFTSSGIVLDSSSQIPADITEDKDALERWRKWIGQQIDGAENPFQIGIMINKPYRLTFLKYAKEYLSQADFSGMLAEAWIASEAPNLDRNIGKNGLLSMFRQADPALLMTEEERNELEMLDNPVTVYRGVTSYNSKNIKVLSWTLDPDVAEWFAHRFDGVGTVYQAEIGKKDIFAFFNRRNESEVIVNPQHLKNITVMQEMNPGMNMM